MDLIKALDTLCDAVQELTELCREQAKIIEQNRLVDEATMQALTDRREAAENKTHREVDT